MCKKIAGVFVALICFGACVYPQNIKGDIWLTTPDRSSLFKLQKDPLSFSTSPTKGPVIVVDDSKKYQPIDGFGFALTGGSAQHIIKMSAAARAALLKELFGTGSDDIGISYLRLSIGASDLNEKIFSYDDLPAGETDPQMQKFDLVKIART